MKYSLLVLCVVLINQNGNCQYSDDGNYISISGNAISSVRPDTYTLIFGLEEYYTDDERGTRRLVTLDEIRSELKTKLAAFGLPDKDLILLGVSSTNHNAYGTGNQPYLRNAYGLISATKDHKLLIRLVENLRFKGLSGINISGDYSDIYSLETAICKEAIDDAELSADSVFEKLTLNKGPVLQVHVNNNHYNMGIDRYNEYANQVAFGQYTFAMATTKIHCDVSLKYAIERD